MYLSDYRKHHEKNINKYDFHTESILQLCQPPHLRERLIVLIYITLLNLDSDP